MNNADSTGNSTHAVIVHFQYGTTDLDPLFKLEDKLEAALEQAGVGELDGHEVAVDGSDGFYYMYGPDADKIFNIAKPILVASEFAKKSTVTLRYGPADEGAKEIEVQLGI